MKLRRITILPFPDTICKKNRSTSFDKKRGAGRLTCVADKKCAAQTAHEKRRGSAPPSNFNRRMVTQGMPKRSLRFYQIQSCHHMVQYKPARRRYPTIFRRRLQEKPYVWRCFPCDDSTPPPRSAAALWDVVSGLIPRSVSNVAGVHSLFSCVSGLILLVFFIPMLCFHPFLLSQGSWQASAREEMSCRRAGGTLQCQFSLRKQRIFHSYNQSSQI